MPGKLLPLFVIEEKNPEGCWESRYIQRAPLRVILGSTSEPRPRARRLKTLEEAKTQAGPLGVGGWLQTITKRIEWPPIKETP